MNYEELTTKFSTEEDCLNYLFNIRWENGYSCPRCECKEKWQVSNNKYKCRQCGYQASIISGTLFHHTHLSMCQWFHAIWYVSMQKGLTTAKGLQTELKLGSNRTALSILNKIKAEMFTMDESRINRYLDGTIDICIKEFQENNNTISLLVAVEVKNRKKGHIRIYQMPKCDTESYGYFLHKNVEPESKLRKERGYHDIRCDIKGYSFNIKDVGNYEAPYANSVYSDFQKYYKKKLEINCKLSVFAIIEEYTYWTNSITNDITFDEILYNAVHYPPNPVVLK